MDLYELKTRTDLLAWVEQDTTVRKVAGTHGGEYAGACPFCGGQDRFRVQPARGLWWCRQCSGEHWQDAIAYVQKRYNVDFREAVKLLGGEGTTHRAAGRPAPRSAAAELPPAPPAAPWQARAALLVDRAAAVLWEPAGARALAYLRGRGLRDDTIRAARLGYIPASWNEPATKWGHDKPVRIPRGVLIPGQVRGVTWYLKVRDPDAEDPKKRYLSVTGSRQVPYLVDALAGRPAVFATEGELDALLLHQEVGDLVDVLTLGSESGRLADIWQPYLLAGQRFYIATDNDPAGEAAAVYWLGLVGQRGERVLPPGGAKDLTDAHLAGSSLRAWVVDLLAPRSSSVDPDDPTTWPVLPSGACPTCGGSTWQRDAALAWVCAGCCPQADIGAAADPNAAL